MRTWRLDERALRLFSHSWPLACQDGLLKPNNHTISVSDVAFIAGFHGLFELRVGEINRFREDGLGVELKDGSMLDVNMIIKCTGFHLNDEVPRLTGFTKMQPYGLLDFNMNYGVGHGVLVGCPGLALLGL